MEDNFGSTVRPDEFGLLFEPHEKAAILKRKTGNKTDIRIKLKHRGLCLRYL